jgi:hypothetical protein
MQDRRFRAAEVIPLDPLLIAVIGALYLSVTGMAMFMPIARTLWLLDPAAALRAE